MDPTIPQKDWQTKIFEAFARKSRIIITLFHIFYYLLILFWVFGAYVILTQGNYTDFLYGLGKHLGQFALAMLGLTVLPGILGRLGIEIRVTRIITLFRRQLGITVFIFGFTHYSFVRLLPQVAGTFPFEIPSPILFENLGILALSILFLMFITSNNASVKKMGRWWKRLHRFVYVAIWLLVFHTGLQKISIWTLGIFCVAILETVSWIFDYFKKKSLGQTNGADAAAGANSVGK